MSERVIGYSNALHRVLRRRIPGASVRLVLMVSRLAVLDGKGRGRWLDGEHYVHRTYGDWCADIPAMRSRRTYGADVAKLASAGVLVTRRWPNGLMMRLDYCLLRSWYVEDGLRVPAQLAPPETG